MYFATYSTHFPTCITCFQIFGCIVRNYNYSQPLVVKFRFLERGKPLHSGPNNAVGDVTKNIPCSTV